LDFKAKENYVVNELTRAIEERRAKLEYLAGKTPPHGLFRIHQSKCEVPECFYFGTFTETKIAKMVSDILSEEFR
jgi:hypothetical protein